MNRVLLDEIEAFIRVAEAGSFTAAAGKLGVPKSTVSRAVTRLEDALRVRLLERAPRAVVLTPAGRRFFADAAPHVAGLCAAARVAGDDPGGQVRGTLRLSAPPDATDAFLGEMLVQFASRHPLVQVQVDLSPRMVDLAREGFDAALRATARVRDPTVVARRLGETEMRLFATPGYLARRGVPRSPDDLASHECVRFNPTGESQPWSLRGPEGATREVQVTGRLAGSDLAFVRAVTRAGAGIGLMPSFLAVEDVAAGTLVRVLPQWARPAGTFFLVYPAGRHVPRRVGAFRDFVVDWFARTPLVG